MLAFCPSKPVACGEGPPDGLLPDGLLPDGAFADAILAELLVVLFAELLFADCALPDGASREVCFPDASVAASSASSSSDMACARYLDTTMLLSRYNPKAQNCFAWPGSNITFASLQVVVTWTNILGQSLSFSFDFTSVVATSMPQDVKVRWISGFAMQLRSKSRSPGWMYNGCPLLLSLYVSFAVRFCFFFLLQSWGS